jgi:ABC-type multidrug transport system ATPase subunit
MLEVKELCKRYRGLPAIDNVSFRIRPGEIVGYVGPNGSGKSTTVKIVTGLIEPNSGVVLFEGESIRNNLKGYRAAFGYVPEEAHVYTHLSGLEYLQLVGRLRGLPESVIDLKANKLLALLGLYISHVLEVVELVCDRVIVIAKGKILADAPPLELRTSLHLSNLESVFAQLVQQQDTRSVAREIVDTIAGQYV